MPADEVPQGLHLGLNLRGLGGQGAHFAELGEQLHEPGLQLPGLLWGAALAFLLKLPVLPGRYAGEPLHLLLNLFKHSLFRP